MAGQPLFGAARRDSIPLSDVWASDVVVLDLYEIIAGKLVALIDRHAARDLFDAPRILSIDGLDRSRIKAALPAIGACGRRDWRIMSVDAIKGDPRELWQQLAISLPRHRFSGKDDVEE
jgi:predicted nucleotidyltransferase component of viral defense system